MSRVRHRRGRSTSGGSSGPPPPTTSDKKSDLEIILFRRDGPTPHRGHDRDRRPSGRRDDGDHQASGACSRIRENSCARASSRRSAPVVDLRKGRPPSFLNVAVREGAGQLRGGCRRRGGDRRSPQGPGRGGADGLALDHRARTEAGRGGSSSKVLDKVKSGEKVKPLPADPEPRDAGKPAHSRPRAGRAPRARAARRQAAASRSSGAGSEPMAKFFINPGPSWRWSISILMVIIGPRPSCSSCPSRSIRRSRRPRSSLTAIYPGRRRGDARAVGGHAHRAADERRRQHDLHVLDEHGERAARCSCAWTST